MQSPYEALGLQVGATRDEIRRAYLARVKVLHPDRYCDAPADVQEAAAAEFRRVQEAYEYLTNAVGRSDESNDRGSGDLQAADSLLVNAIRIAADSGSRQGGEPANVRGFAADVLVIARRELPEVHLPTGWDGDRVEALAFLALCAAMDRLAGLLSSDDLDGFPVVSAAFEAYSIAFIACACIWDFDDLPPGFGMPIPPSTRILMMDDPEWEASPGFPQPPSAHGAGNSVSWQHQSSNRWSSGWQSFKFWLAVGLALLVGISLWYEQAKPNDVPSGRGSSAEVATQATTTTLPRVTTTIPRWDVGACLETTALDGGRMRFSATSCSGPHDGVVVGRARDADPEVCRSRSLQPTEERYGVVWCLSLR